MTLIEVPNGGTLYLNAPIFVKYDKSNGGFLCSNESCHALFYYALLARQAYERNVRGDAIQYEGTIDNTTNFKQLMVSISMLYGIEPEEMPPHWPEIDAQFIFLGQPTVPNEENYRQNRPLIIN